MKATALGMCTEVSVSSGGYIHICAFEDNHDPNNWHRCSCGQSFNNRDVINTARRKVKRISII